MEPACNTQQLWPAGCARQRSRQRFADKARVQQVQVRSLAHAAVEQTNLCLKCPWCRRTGSCTRLTVLYLCRSPSDVQREYLRQWKEVTARDGTVQPQTILSTLWFVPVWFKYNATPYILRYLVYCVWVVIKAAYFRWHKAMVLRGAPCSCLHKRWLGVVTACVGAAQFLCRGALSYFEHGPMQIIFAQCLSASLCTVCFFVHALCSTYHAPSQHAVAQCFSVCIHIPRLCFAMHAALGCPMSLPPLPVP